MTDSDRPPLNDEDRHWVDPIRTHTEWGERSPMERRAFTARLEDRIEKRAPRIGGRVAWAGAAVAAAALAFALLPRSSGPPRDPVAKPAGRGFLTAAYYGGAESDASSWTQDGSEPGVEATYLPADLQVWSDALDLTDEAALGAS